MYVHVPERLPQALNAFMLSFQVSDIEHDCLVHISQTYGSSATEESVSVILNIQAFKNLNLRADQISDDELWRTFDELRLAKDKAFEGSITDKVREMIR